MEYDRFDVYRDGGSSRLCILFCFFDCYFFVVFSKVVKL